MFGLIIDENGDLVLNVLIIIKDFEWFSFEQVVEGNKKGCYKIYLVNVMVFYLMMFLVLGFQIFLVNGVKVIVCKDMCKNFEMKF